MAFVVYLLADGGSDFGHMGWGDGAWWMMLFWGPVLVIALIAVVIWAIRSSPRRDGPASGEGDPLDGARRILAERYARGELDSEEYRERMEQLS